LSTQAARTPVITPHGYLYDKECILENLLTQKADIKRKMKAYERQLREGQADQAVKSGKANDAAMAEFVKKERGFAVGGAAKGVTDPFEKKAVEISRAGQMLAMQKETRITKEGKVTPKLPAFWLPTLQPDAKETQLKAPDTKTKCPMSGKNLVFKDLITVNFKPADKLSTVAMVARDERYVCSLTDKVLRNAIPCVVLKPSGRVITKEAFEKLVKPDMVDPVSGEALTMADIIPMASCGTGYAGGGATIKKAKTGAAIMYG
jgi:nitric oxide synthase-interacting protein